ncbi:MAG: hypothetical protein AB7U43_12550 [Desulfobacter sp.]
MKKCFKCGTEKPLTEFYRHSQMADGHLGKCKDCAKKDVHAHRLENLERIQDYDRQRSKSSHRKLQRKIYADNHSDIMKFHKKAYIERNPEKRAAHVLVGNAIRAGKLLRQPCIVCQSVSSEAHHEDYSRPLDVIWLCRKHHSELHEQRLDYRRAA